MSHMIRRIKKFFVKIYASLTRIFKRVKISNAKVYFLPAEEFSKRINEMDYKADPINGLIDYVADPDLFFDSSRNFGRDCDDWARQWSIWGYHNGYLAEEYFVYNPKRLFKSAHVVTLLWRNGNCFLANYNLFGPFFTQEDAFEYLKNYKSYKDGIDWVFSRKISK